MGSQIPGYKIVRFIADGGMASVYLAVQESLGRRVAIKLLKKYSNIYQSALFHKEGQIIASLNHRNIITIYDIGVIGEQYFISMEYLEGGDLRERISTGMSTAAALDLVEVIGACLDCIHRKDIIHRDIKPGNILFHSDGTPILTDFGVAKQQEVDIRQDADGTTVGSPYYISPEQAEGNSLDGRADIYSLGIIFHEMLTGVKPFRGDSHVETIIAHLTDPLPSLPPELGRYQPLLDRMIAKDREDRFASAAEMVECLRGLRRDDTADAPATGSPGCWHDTSVTPAVAKERVSGNIHRQLPGKTGILTLGVIASLLAIAAVSLNVWHLLEVRPEQTLAGRGQTVVAQAATNPAGRHEMRHSKSGSALQHTGYPSPATAAGAGDNAALQSVALQTPVNTPSRHEEWLNQARQAVRKFRYTRPEQESAFHYYQLVLMEDPYNQEALEGLAKLAEIHADLVEWAMGMHEYRKAKDYLYEGLRVEPDNARLQTLLNSEAFR